MNAEDDSLSEEEKKGCYRSWLCCGCCGSNHANEEEEMKKHHAGAMRKDSTHQAFSCTPSVRKWIFDRIFWVCCLVHEKTVLKSVALEVKELILSEPVDSVGAQLPKVTVFLEEGQKRGFKIDTNLQGDNAFGVTHVYKWSDEWDRGVRVGHKLKYINGSKPSIDLYENSQNRSTTFIFGPWGDGESGGKRKGPIRDRKFDYILVFSRGGVEKYNSLPNERKRELFKYMRHAEDDPDLRTQSNEASLKAKTNDKTSKIFVNQMNKTFKVLKQNGFHVRWMRKKDFPHEVLAAIDDKYEFLQVGMTEQNFRKWAEKSRYELELEPFCSMTWLKWNKDPLATATLRDVETESIRLATEDDWRYIYSPYRQGIPQQCFRTYPIMWQKDPTLGDSTLFRTLDRAKLIRSKMEAPEERDGLGMNLDGLALEEDHALETSFPLHYEEEHDDVHDAIWNSVFNLPVDEIRDYYGEYIGIYFAFMEYLNLWLLFPTILGVVVFLCQVYEGRINNSWSVLLAIFIIFWQHAFLENWKYRECELQRRWGQSSYKRVAHPRPQFDGDWVWSPANGQLVPYFDPMTKKRLQCLSFCIVSVCIGLLAVNLWLLEALRITIEHHFAQNENGQTVAFGVFSAVQIAIFDEMYTRLALWLNEKENHETDADYERSLIMKNFTFRFVNSYNSLFFVAFVKYYVDDCNGTPEDGCFDELRLTLFSLFAMKSIILDNFMEYMTPLFNRYCGNSTLAAIRADAAGMSPVWKQFRAEEYGETFEDFNEVILRFGFATIFIIAFPLVALLGLVANIVEIKIDSGKFRNLYRRPDPKGAESIYPWTLILSMMVWVSTITNLAIILIIFQSFENMVSLPHTSPMLIGLALLSEFLVVIFFFVLLPYWNRRPEEIRRHEKRQKHIRKALFHISLDLKSDFSDYKMWSKSDFRNYLSGEGQTRHERFIEQLHEAHIDGNFFKNIDSESQLKSRLEKRLVVRKKDVKFAWSMIEILRHSSPIVQMKTSEMDDIFDRMKKVKHFAETKKLKRNVDTSTLDQVFREFSFFKYSQFVESLKGWQRKELLAAIHAKHRNESFVDVAFDEHSRGNEWKVKMNFDDVKDWVVTGVKPGGQFHRHSVIAGWRIRQVAIENLIGAKELPDLYSRDESWNNLKYYKVNKTNRDMLKKHLMNGNPCTIRFDTPIKPLDAQGLLCGIITMTVDLFLKFEHKTIDFRLSDKRFKKLNREIEDFVLDQFDSRLKEVSELEHGLGRTRVQRLQAEKLVTQIAPTHAAALKVFHTLEDKQEKQEDDLEDLEDEVLGEQLFDKLAATVRKMDFEGDVIKEVWQNGDKKERVATNQLNADVSIDSFVVDFSNFNYKEDDDNPFSDDEI